jgi:ribosome biogenesis GTPase
MTDSSGMNERLMQGIVVRAHGKWFTVEVPGSDTTWLATPKGTLKRGRQLSDPVVVGDRVLISDAGDGEARIEQVAERRTVLARPQRGSAVNEQILLANLDQALFVFAVRHPEPHRRMLDRFLVLAEDRGLPAMVGVNKLDLDEALPDGQPLSRSIFGDYEPIYPVFYFSTKSGEGIADLSVALEGKTTVLTGPSGVGKSSILNALGAERVREIGAISSATGKGRHTTTSAELIRLDDATFVADTPGIRSLAMHGVAPEMLDHCFRELQPLLGRCFYADCKHLTEPGCAVLEAVSEGKIAPERYESYAALRRGDRD